MTRTCAAALAAVLVLAGACARQHRARTPHPPEMSGFLDDYGQLREGGPGEPSLVYRNPAANWSSYDKVLLEPVSLWRSGARSLDPLPRQDLLRLVSTFDAAVRRRLGEGFQLVSAPGPGVMRVLLAITDARASDPVVDILTATPNRKAPPAPDSRLDPETRTFLATAAVEGELRDAQTGTLLAAAVDRRGHHGPPAPLETWSDVDRALAFWADRICDRLEARAGRP
jgi:Protein of unknown function (DUF3313)